MGYRQQRQAHRGTYNMRQAIAGKHKRSNHGLLEGAGTVVRKDLADDNGMRLQVLDELIVRQLPMAISTIQFKQVFDSLLLVASVK